MIDFLFNLLDKIFKKDKDIHIDNSQNINQNQRITVGDINSNNTSVIGSQNVVGNTFNYNFSKSSEDCQDNKSHSLLLKNIILALFLVCAALFMNLSGSMYTVILIIINFFIGFLIYLLYIYNRHNGEKTKDKSSVFLIILANIINSLFISQYLNTVYFIVKQNFFDALRITEENPFMLLIKFFAKPIHDYKSSLVLNRGIGFVFMYIQLIFLIMIITDIKENRDSNITRPYFYTAVVQLTLIIFGLLLYIL